MTDESTPTTAEQSDDVEAHVMRGRIAPVPQPAETEAHALKARGRNEDAEPPQKGTERDSAQDEGPEVEGHALRGKA